MLRRFRITGFLVLLAGFMLLPGCTVFKAKKCNECPDFKRKKRKKVKRKKYKSSLDSPIHRDSQTIHWENLA